MKEKYLSYSCVSIRKNPKNLIESDIALFNHELQKDIQGVKQLTLSNIYVTGTGFTIAKQGKVFPESFSKATGILFFSALQFFLHLFKRIIRNRFTIIKPCILFTIESANTNYFHWITEALPRLLAGGVDLKKHALILPKYYSQFSFIGDTLKCLGFSVRYMRKENFYLLKKVLFITHFATAGNYHDDFILKTQAELKNGLPDYRADKLIYISRSRAERRKIANEEDLIPLLSKLGFAMVYCEDLNLDEQRILFSQTNVLVSNHGAGLTNMIFMPKGSSVLELRYKDDNHNNCYFSLASALDINYYYQQCLPVNPALDPYEADLIADKESFTTLLLQICNNN